MLLASRLAPTGHSPARPLHETYRVPVASGHVAVVAVRLAKARSRQGRESPVACPAAKGKAAAAGGAAADEDDEDAGDDEAPVAGRALRVERLLANLGYGKRRECQLLVKKGRVTRRDGGKLKVGDKVMWGEVELDGEQLDPPSPLMLALHKPTGYVVTSPDDEKVVDEVVYDLLPYRFGRRRPFLSCVGRLDKDTSGLLLLTDDGTLLHRINSPKRGIWKVYEATLADPMTPKQAEAAARKFSSGTIVLEGDYAPLLPAKLDMTGERTARVAICEGKYHQVRRMFAAVGNTVVALRRVSVGGLTLGSLPEGEWRHLTPQDLDLVFEGPTTEEVMAGSSTVASGSGTPCSSGADTLNSSSNSGGGSDSNVASATAASVEERDGGPTASSSNSNSSIMDPDASSGVRITKKEKKKGKKKRSEARTGDNLSNSSGSFGANGGKAHDPDEDEGEDEDIADVEILSYDDGDEGTDSFGEEEGALEGHRRTRRLPRRPPLVRQGTVLYDNTVSSRGGVKGLDGLLDEQLPYGGGVDDGAAAEVLSAGAGDGVRKYRDGVKWRRRRDALRQILPS